MVDCRICKALELGTRTIYRDETVSILMPSNVSSPGELFVVPNTHEILFENLSDELSAHMAVIANKASVALVSALKCEGTNLLVQSGEPAGQSFSHAIIRVIPRFSGDSLSFEWEPQKLSEDEMSTIELKLREACKAVFFQKEESNDVLDLKNQRVDALDSKEISNLLAHLKRLP